MAAPALRPEYYLQQIISSEPTNAEDEVLNTSSEDSTRDRLSRHVREISRLVPRQENKPGSGFCPLKETILFLTSEDAELGEEHEEATEFYAFFFTDEFCDPLPPEEDYQEILKDLESRSRGLPAGTWVQRMAKLEKDLKINNPLSGDDLRSLGAQMSNNRHGGDGFAINWQDMEAYICFGETAAKDADPAKIRDRARVLNDVRTKLKDAMKSDNFFKDRLAFSDAKAHVAPHRFHRWIMEKIDRDLTEMEVQDLLREIRRSGKNKGSSDKSVQVDHHTLTKFLYGAGKAKEDDRDVIVDIQVGSPDTIVGQHYQRVVGYVEDQDQDIDCNLSTGVKGDLVKAPMYIYYLTSSRARGPTTGDLVRPPTTRLAPVVDVRIECEPVSTDMVAAGYTCCVQMNGGRLAAGVNMSGGAGANARYLWFRRAANQTEARSHALTGLKFTKGNMRKMQDHMHTPPGGHDSNWQEVVGRQKGSMALKLRNGILSRSEDLKLWSQTSGNASTYLEDRVDLCITKWNETIKARELELAVRRGLRQRHKSHDEDLTTPPDFAGLYNDHLPSGKRKLPRKDWHNLLFSAGLCLHPRDVELLMRRISSREDSERFGGVEREDFISFVSKTDLELENSAVHLKHELRRRHGLATNRYRYKLDQRKSLEALCTQACRADQKGLSLAHFSFLLCSIDEYLTDAETVRLVQRFDPAFRGSVDIERFLDFVCSDREAPGERAERVVLAAQSLCEIASESSRETPAVCYTPFTSGRAGRAESASDAVNKMWSQLMQRHHARKRAAPSIGQSISNALSGVPTEDNILQPEDLAMAIERRRNNQLGVRGAVRLSPLEAQQLVMLMAPTSNNGFVTEKDFKSFFDLTSARQSIRMQARPLGELLEVLRQDWFLGDLVKAYKEWYKAKADKADKCRDKYEKKREDKVNELLEATSVAVDDRHVKRRIGLREFTAVKWPSNISGRSQQSPFENPAELALVAMHTGADDILDPDDDNTELYCVKIRTFVDGVCRLIHGDIEPKEEERAEKKRPTGNKSHMSTVCTDMRNEIDSKSKNKGSAPDYLSWAQEVLTEFQVATPNEVAKWCDAVHPTGVPIKMFVRLMMSFNDTFGWELSSKQISDWCEEWDSDKDQHIRSFEIEEFVDGTSKAWVDSSIGKSLESEVKFTLFPRNSEAEKLVLKVTKQLKTKYVALEVQRAVADLQQAFSQPLVDPYPSKGAVGFEKFRKAMRHAGVILSVDEDKKGTEYFIEGSDKSDGMIDYMHFISQIRRAWMVVADENHSITGIPELDKKLDDLRKEFRSMTSGLASGERYAPQKMFTKMDKNHDGKITVKEFMEGMKTLKVQTQMSREDFEILFEVFDDNGDEGVDYEEFYNFLLQGAVGNHLRKRDLGRQLHDEGYDSDGDSVLGEPRVKHDYFAPVRSAINQQWRTDAQREQLRSYLRRHDLNSDRTISEKAFLRFLRKAHLNNCMSRRQLQALVQVLDPKATHWLNYDMFIRKAIDRSGPDPVRWETQPKQPRDEKLPYRHNGSDVTPMLQHILETVTTAHQRGQLYHDAFPDAKGLGVVATETARRSLRRLGVVLTDEEFERVFAIIPQHRASDGSVDYMELYNLLLATTPRQGAGYSMLPPGPPRAMGYGYAAVQTPATPFTPYPDMRASAMLNTTGYGVPPGGYPGAAQFPVDPRLSMIGGLNSSMASLGGLGGDAVLFNELAQRIRYASREQSSVYGPHGSLRRTFETTYDPGMRGVVSIYDLQTVLNQMGVTLTAMDLAAIRSRFDRTGNGTLDYVSFCREVEGEANVSVNDFVGKIANCLADQRRRGTDVRFVFVMNDPRDTGFVSLLQFREALRQLGVALTEAQTSTLCNKFAQAGNPNMISYDEFLEYVGRAAVPLMDSLERSTVDYGASRVFEGRSMRGTGGGTGRMNRSIDDAGAMGMVDPSAAGWGLNRGSVADWYTSASPKLRREFREVNNSISRFRDIEDDDVGIMARESTPKRQGGWRAEEVGFGPSSPERVVNHAREAEMRGSFEARDRGSFDRSYNGGYSGANSPGRDAAIAVWGAQTPLGSKGKVPASMQQKLQQQGRWMCLTCLYFENDEGSPECTMCGAANPKHKSSVVHQECWHCHHRNLEFAETCAMCSKPLSGAAASKSRAGRMEADESGFGTRASETSGFRDVDSPRAMDDHF